MPRKRDAVDEYFAMRERILARPTISVWSCILSALLNLGFAAWAFYLYGSIDQICERPIRNILLGSGIVFALACFSILCTCCHVNSTFNSFIAVADHLPPQTLASSKYAQYTAKLQPIPDRPPVPSLKSVMATTNISSSLMAFSVVSSASLTSQSLDNRRNRKERNKDYASLEEPASVTVTTPPRGSVSVSPAISPSVAPSVSEGESPSKGSGLEEGEQRAGADTGEEGGDISADDEPAESKQDESQGLLSAQDKSAKQTEESNENTLGDVIIMLPEDELPDGLGNTRVAAVTITDSICMACCSTVYTLCTCCTGVVFVLTCLGWTWLETNNCRFTAPELMLQTRIYVMVFLGSMLLHYGLCRRGYTDCLFVWNIHFVGQSLLKQLTQKAHKKQRRRSRGRSRSRSRERSSSKTSAGTGTDPANVSARRRSQRP